MRLDTTLFSAVALLAVGALGCGDEVGACESELQEGEDTVLVGNTVQFGGQAIMNQACAGCHSSTAKGAARRGAPAGLDFDLFPVDPDDETMVDGTDELDGGGTYIKLKRAAWAGLRERQRRIFEERNLIWQQVKDEMMPPAGGMFASFRTLSSIVGTDDSQPCTADIGAYAPITEKSSRDVLRKWLACRAPVVEINSNEVAGGKSSTTDGGVVRAAGLAGYQYLICGDTDGGTGGTVTFETVYKKIIAPKCVNCHAPAFNYAPFMDTVDKAFEVLVDDIEAKCGGKPYVTSGDPTMSYLYELVSTTPSCSSGMRMPPGGQLARAEQKLISDWIAGGALRDSDVEKQQSTMRSLQRGMDAGVP